MLEHKDLDFCTWCRQKDFVLEQKGLHFCMDQMSGPDLTSRTAPLSLERDPYT